MAARSRRLARRIESEASDHVSHQRSAEDRRRSETGSKPRRRRSRPGRRPAPGWVRSRRCRPPRSRCRGRCRMSGAAPAGDRFGRAGGLWRAQFGGGGYLGEQLAVGAVTGRTRSRFGSSANSATGAFSPAGREPSPAVGRCWVYWSTAGGLATAADVGAPTTATTTAAQIRLHRRRPSQTPPTLSTPLHSPTGPSIGHSRGRRGVSDRTGDRRRAAARSGQPSRGHPCPARSRAEGTPPALWPPAAGRTARPGRTSCRRCARGTQRSGSGLPGSAAARSGSVPCERSQWGANSILMSQSLRRSRSPCMPDSTCRS